MAIFHCYVERVRIWVSCILLIISFLEGAWSAFACQHHMRSVGGSVCVHWVPQSPWFQYGFPLFLE
jgi:hypothetical protein